MAARGQQDPGTEAAAAVEFTRRVVDQTERMLCELSAGTLLVAAEGIGEGEEAEEGRRSLEHAQGEPVNVARGKQAATAHSPDGRWIAECVDHNVYLRESAAEGAGQEGTGLANRRAITTGGTRKFGFGRASWVYGEELDQKTAIWWSPDSLMLAFYRFDDGPVPDFVLPVGWTTTRPEMALESYPKAGEPNPIAGLLVHHMASGAQVAIEVGEGDQYIYAVQWTPDGRELLFLRTNRQQDRLELVAADPLTGQTRVVLRETQPTFQDNRPTLRFLDDGERFIWETERSGWANYELRSLHGSERVELTRGAYPVLGIELVDENAGWLYYRAASGAIPLQTQLHRVRLDGSGEARLTPDELHHSGFEISPDHQAFVCAAEAIDTPPSTALFDMRGRRIATLAESDTSRMTALNLPRPERFEFTAADGTTRLWGALYKPRNFDPARRYPLIIDVYGGPGVRGLTDRWEGAKAECELGFLVARLENRGTRERGKAFESATWQKLGQVDLADQAAGVRHLAARPEVDGSRVGIHGASYGGTMAILALLRHPELFHAAVATSGVTDWRQYDTIYTERYMGTPQENAAGYDAGSCVKLAEQLSGPQPWKLLIMHGMEDDNVHPTNAFALIDVLQSRDIPFEMALFPRADHRVSGNAAKGARWRFFVDALGGPLEQAALGE
jgi:dipeptidyl-peptidase-4